VAGVLDGQTAPRRLFSAIWEAYFGPRGEVIFEGEENGTPFVYRIR
jgi:hypothetical protein